MANPRAREVAKAIGPPYVAVDDPGATRFVSGWGSGGDERRLTLRHDLPSGGRVEVETSSGVRRHLGDWERFSRSALMGWGLTRGALDLPATYGFETRHASIPVDGHPVPLYFLGDQDVWVVGGWVGIRWIEATGVGFAVDDLRLTVLVGLESYEFLDERGGATP